MADDREALFKTIRQTAQCLASGETSSRDLVEASFALLREQRDENDRAFVRVFEAQALAAAEKADRAPGARRSLIGGIPITVKDNISLAESAATAGSLALALNRGRPGDAAAIARLRAANAIIIGHTNMTEFAYSGLGLNPHHGSPRNPFDARRVPGGSSSGAAVSVARGYAQAALGTDTAGSVRIPAAYCGLVGFKPSQRSISRKGVIPLAPSLDCVGVLARSVSCCATVHNVMIGSPAGASSHTRLERLQLACPNGWLTDALSPKIAQDFERASQRLRQAGATLIETRFEAPRMLAETDVLGQLIAPEALSQFRELCTRDAALIDPIILGRLNEASAIPERSYREARRLRRAAITLFAAEAASFDAIVAPTVAISPPRLDDVVDFADFNRMNRLVLRNTAYANLLDLPAITLPMHRDESAPTGLMLIGRPGRDAELLRIAQTIEEALAAD